MKNTSRFRQGSTASFGRWPTVVSVARRFVLVCFAFAALAHGSAHAQTVGHVSFVIGKVSVESADGGRRTVSAGDPLRAGDAVLTDRGQHLHVRFIDDGFVSVRPGSHFIIERYEVGSDGVAISFALKRGVVRSITGRAAEAQRDRFRLNVPMAAIGVRGTDFVVKAGPDSLQAVVNTGAIVVAPFGEGCAATGLGPCLTASAAELSENMGQVLLELTVLGGAKIVPIEASAPVRNGGEAVQEPPSTRDIVSMLETTTGDSVEDRLVFDRTQLPGSGQIPDGQSPGPAVATSLAWGRWSEVGRPGDGLSVSYDEAREGRQITVGNSYAGLFRDDVGPRLLDPQLGRGNFALVGAQVGLIGGDGAISAGRVDDGWLRIDFANRSFDTGLSLSHAVSGPVQFNASGSVSEEGLFVARYADGRIAGAATLDGQEAGYLFEQRVPQGVLSGTTLWTR